MKQSQRKALDNEQKLHEEVTELFPIELRNTAPEEVERILNEGPGIMDIVRGHNTGNEHASYFLADVFYNGYLGIHPSYEKAFNLYETLALKGYSEAQYCLGVMYFNGEGIEQNYEKALEYLLESAEQGFALAQYLVGYMYYIGIGIEKDDKKAFNWFIQSAEQGDVDAQFRLGYMYCLGHGTKQNYEKALEWFNESAKQGNEYAKTAYIMCNTASKGSKRMQYILFGWGFLNPNASFSCTRKAPK